MSYDVEAIRKDFPALQSCFVHLDGPGGTQTPESVAWAVARTMTASLSNRGTVTVAERFADSVVKDARNAMADLLGVDPQGVIFGRSMTDLTFALARTLSKGWAPGDEIVVCRIDHAANITPWQIAAERAGATVRWIEFDPASTELAVEDVARVLCGKTRLVAMTAASNLMGTRPPVAEISRIVHEAGALFYVDGVHLTPHAPVDVPMLGADFYACSLYKFFGPHCAAIAASPQLLSQLVPDKLPTTPDTTPERFELGTMPYELLAGVTATVDYLADQCPENALERRTRVLRTMTLVEEHELATRERLERELIRIPGLVIYSRAKLRTPTLLFRIEGRHPAEVRQFLAERQIGAPAGTFNAVGASQALGLSSEGGVRVGLAAYTSDGDVDRLLESLDQYTSGTPRAEDTSITRSYTEP